MDNSKEYVDMCRKAVEVQRLWKAEVGDWFVTPIGKVDLFDKSFYIKENFICDHDIIENELWERKKIYWLPRQDQLQGMVNISKIFGFYGLIETFNKFSTGKTCAFGSENQCIAHLKQFKSMEQVWLAYIMWGKYDKKWDGQDWIEN